MRDYHRAIERDYSTVDAFLQKTFTRVTVDGPDLSTEGLDSCPAMVVCSHRSHTDYVILGVELHKMGMGNLRFAAGDNLTNLPILGKRLRSYGAFSVYRARARDRSYIRELTDRVAGMLNQGDKVVVFPEGGRSYSGRMMEFKSGVMAANILAQYRSSGRDYVFLPITISYECLPELRYLGILRKGKILRSNGARLLHKAFGDMAYFGADALAFSKFRLAPGLGRRYGEVYVDYGLPIKVSDLVDLQANYSTGARSELSAHRSSLQEVAAGLRARLLGLYRILPMHVVAGVLSAKAPVERSRAVDMARSLVADLRASGRNCKSLTYAVDTDLVDHGMSQLRRFRAVTNRRGELAIRNREIVDYYASTVVKS